MRGWPRHAHGPLLSVSPIRQPCSMNLAGDTDDRRSVKVKWPFVGHLGTRSALVDFLNGRV